MTGRDDAESGTQALHRLTSYDVNWGLDRPAEDPRVLQDFTDNDPDHRPQPTKRYDPGLPRTPLPRELPTSDVGALAVLAGSARPVVAPLDLAGLGRVLYLSAGVVRTMKRNFGMFLFRAAGSAGGRFPLELYVAIPDGCVGLPAGVHWYDPVEHALVRIGPSPRPVGSSTGAPTIVVTGVPWRTGWRYRERGFRHVYWDAGTMLSQLLSLADSSGYAPRLYTHFPDAAVSELVGADGVQEWPVAVVTLGDESPAIVASGPAVAGFIDADAVEFPLVTAAQRAGDMNELGRSWPTGAVVQLPASESPPLDDVIARRGSQRRMDPSRGLPLETLRTSMSVALRGISVEHWIAVHDVTGLAPGIYRWPAMSEPVRSSSQARLREEVHRVCLDQTLGRDAAFVVIAATDVSQLSDRQYREAQLAAGLAEGRLHLAAYALGAGACGMTFLDTEVPALLAAEGPSPDGDHRDGLIFTCVGVPGNTSKPAGRPGTPNEIRMVSPRE